MTRFDWIVFDLDDTLMDTFGQLVMPAVRESCAAMIQAGLRARLADAVSARQKMFRYAPSADHFARLIEIFGLQPDSDHDRVHTSGRRAYFERDVESHIQPFNGVEDLLADLSRHYALYLVTSGHPQTQCQKVQYLGLETHFEAVFYVNNGRGEQKLGAFEKLLADTGHPPQRTLCVGDRPDREIRDANLLGMETVRHRHGEYFYLEPRDPLEKPDHEIRTLDQLKPLLKL